MLYCHPLELWEEVAPWPAQHPRYLALDLARCRSPRHYTRHGAWRHVAPARDVGQAEAPQDEFRSYRSALMGRCVNHNVMVII